MTLTLLNSLFFVCLALILEWARVTKTSLITTGRDVLRDLKSIVETPSNVPDFVTTLRTTTIPGTATAIKTVLHTTSSAPFDALKSFLLYYVLFTYTLRAYRHVRARGLWRCIGVFASGVAKVCSPSIAPFIVIVTALRARIWIFTERPRPRPHPPSWAYQGPT